MSVVLISGSPSPRSRSTALLAEAARLLERGGIETHLLSVRDLPAEDLLHGRHDSPAIKSVARQIDASWAVVIATPIYKAAAAGVLKALLDLLPQNILAGKAVFPVAVGGSLAHLLAVDYSLRPVLAALGATTVLATLYAVDSQLRVEASGEAQIDPDIAARIDDGVRKLIHSHGPAEAKAGFVQRNRIHSLARG
jgi:FMN reductase